MQQALAEVLGFIAGYKYLAIIPVAIAEGPIISVISGILISQGHLSFLPVFTIILLGDFVSDTTLYLVGRFGRTKIKYVKAIREEQIRAIEEEFAAHPTRTFLVGKLSYGLGSFFILSAGITRMPYLKFLRHLSLPVASRTIALMGIGYYFGKGVLGFKEYLKYYAIAVVVIVPLAYYARKKLRERGHTLRSFVGLQPRKDGQPARFPLNWLG